MRSICLYALLMAVASVKCSSRDGYIINKSDGHAYKLVYQAKPWAEARKLCTLQGAKLAVPKSEKQFAFIQNLVRGMHYPSVTGTRFKLVVWLGIYNLDDYKVWKSVDGEDIKETGFNKWASGNNGITYSNDPKEPHCAGLDAINAGLRDYWCHRPLPYICELHL